MISYRNRAVRYSRRARKVWRRATAQGANSYENKETDTSRKATAERSTKGQRCHSDDRTGVNPS